jgi:hypothetical protein
VIFFHVLSWFGFVNIPCYRALDGRQVNLVLPLAKDFLFFDSHISPLMVQGISEWSRAGVGNNNKGFPRLMRLVKEGQMKLRKVVLC